MNLLKKLIQLLKCCKKNNVIEEAIEVVENTNSIFN